MNSIYAATLLYDELIRLYHKLCMSVLPLIQKSDYGPEDALMTSNLIQSLDSVSRADPNFGLQASIRNSDFLVSSKLCMIESRILLRFKMYFGASRRICKVIKKFSEASAGIFYFKLIKNNSFKANAEHTEMLNGVCYLAVQGEGGMIVRSL